MRHIIAITVATGLLALASTAPAVAAPHRPVPFEALVHDLNLVALPCEAGVCHGTFEGEGVANIMGRIAFGLDFVQDFNVLPCNPYHGTITFTGSTGSISLADQGTVCAGAGPHPVSRISTRWDVTGGTGKSSGVTGRGTSFGIIGDNGPVVLFSGTVKY
jgi:hypothetical protein